MLEHVTDNKKQIEHSTEKYEYSFFTRNLDNAKKTISPLSKLSRAMEYTLQAKVSQSRKKNERKS